MEATDIPQEALPFLILAKMESSETMEMASAAMCLFTQQPGLVKLFLLLRLLQLKIVEKYPMGLEFGDVEPLEDHEGEPFITRGKSELKMGDDKLVPPIGSVREIPDTRRMMMIAMQGHV